MPYNFVPPEFLSEQDSLKSANLFFGRLRAANRARLPHFKNRRGESYHASVLNGAEWTLTQWSNAVIGEIGEAANFAKKIDRKDFAEEELGVVFSRCLPDEFADIMIYMDVLALRIGLSPIMTDWFHHTVAPIDFARPRSMSGWTNAIAICFAPLAMIADHIDGGDARVRTFRPGAAFAIGFTTVALVMAHEAAGSYWQRATADKFNRTSAQVRSDVTLTASSR